MNGRRDRLSKPPPKGSLRMGNNRRKEAMPRERNARTEPSSKAARYGRVKRRVNIQGSRDSKLRREPREGRDGRSRRPKKVLSIEEIEAKAAAEVAAEREAKMTEEAKRLREVRVRYEGECPALSQLRFVGRKNKVVADFSSQQWRITMRKLVTTTKKNRSKGVSF